MEPNFSIYLDQGLISDLRRNNTRSGQIRVYLNRFESVAFVYSDTHAREITRSGRPLEYIEALEGIGAYYLPPTDLLPKIKDRTSNVQANVVREIVPVELDFEFKSQLAIENTLRLLSAVHVCGGFLDLTNERDQILAAMDKYFDEFRQEVIALCAGVVDSTALIGQLEKQMNEAKSSVQALNTKQLEEEAKDFHENFTKQKPVSQAELDQIPADEVAEYLLSRLPDNEWIKSNYPKGFGQVQLETGKIAGFAFLLFSLGVSPLRRPQKGGPANYLRRFVAQYRDCEHIEHATRCHWFLTKDKGAARLARATYSYAGIPTEVAILEYVDQKKI